MEEHVSGARRPEKFQDDAWNPDEFFSLGRAFLGFVCGSVSEGLGVKDNERSQHRQDATWDRVNDMLKKKASSEIVTIVDCGCGYGIIPERIRKEMIDDGDPERIYYWGYDSDPNCINHLDTWNEEGRFKHFGKFAPILRKIYDMHDGRMVDLVLLLNCLHELEPSRFPEMFASLNEILSDDGMIFIVDMEKLNPPEADAITWKCDEVIQVLLAGGFTYRKSKPMKTVQVLAIDVDKCKGHVDKDAMRTAIGKLLFEKMLAAINERRKAKNNIRGDKEEVMKWVEQTTLAARCMEELERLKLISGGVSTGALKE